MIPCSLGNGEAWKAIQTGNPVREAGGMVINSNEDLIQALYSVPQSIWEIYRMTPNGLLIENLKTGKQNWDNLSPAEKDKVRGSLNDMLKSSIGGVFGITKLLQYLPYLLVAGLALGGIYLIKK